MWWDQSDVCQDSAINLSSSSLDDILKHEELFPTSTRESEEEQDSDCCSILSSSVSSTSTINQAIFIEKVLTSISKVAPDSVFSRQKSRRRRARKMRRLLHPELFSIWYHSSQLTSSSTFVSKKTVPSPYPEVDWSCVNKRFLNNVPCPVQFPVHGCSEDEDFYVTKYARSD